MNEPTAHKMIAMKRSTYEAYKALAKRLTAETGINHSAAAHMRLALERYVNETENQWEENNGKTN